MSLIGYSVLTWNPLPGLTVTRATASAPALTSAGGSTASVPSLGWSRSRSSSAPGAGATSTGPVAAGLASPPVVGALAPCGTAITSGPPDGGGDDTLSWLAAD